MGYDCWGRPFGRIIFSRKFLRIDGWSEFCNANFPRKHGVFGGFWKWLKTNGFWDGHFFPPPEALRQVPLAGTASLVGAIPMRPLTWTKGVGRSNDKRTRLFRCFFLWKVPETWCLATICSVYLSMNRGVYNDWDFYSTEIIWCPRLLDAGSRLQWSQCSCLGGKSVEESVVVKQGKEREKCEIDQFQVNFQCRGCVSVLFSPSSPYKKAVIFLEYPPPNAPWKDARNPRCRSKRVWSVFLNLVLECWCWPMWARKTWECQSCVSVMWPRIVQDFFFKFMKMFCLECLAFVEKYGILKPTWVSMFRIHFLVFSPLQGDRWWSFAVVAASALERISTSRGDAECKSLTISLPSKFEISKRLGRLSIQNENAWVLNISEKFLQYMSPGGSIWRLTLSLWLDRPWSARPVGLGDLMDVTATSGVTFEREKPVIHWFSDFCGSFSRFSGTLKWSRLSFVGCWPCFWWTRFFFWKCWRLRHKFWTPSHLLISWRIGFNTMWVPPPAGAQRDIHADESKDFRILLRMYL